MTIIGCEKSCLDRSEFETLQLPVFGISLHLNCEARCGCVRSDLRPANVLDGEEDLEADNEASDWYSAYVIEVLVLSHALAGVDVTDPAYLEGIESAVAGLGLVS